MEPSCGSLRLGLGGSDRAGRVGSSGPGSRSPTRSGDPPPPRPPRHHRAGQPRRPRTPPASGRSSAPSGTRCTGPPCCRPRLALRSPRRVRRGGPRAASGSSATCCATAGTSSPTPTSRAPPAGWSPDAARPGHRAAQPHAAHGTGRRSATRQPASVRTRSTSTGRPVARPVAAWTRPPRTRRTAPRRSGPAGRPRRPSPRPSRLGHRVAKAGVPQPRPGHPATAALSRAAAAEPGASAACEHRRGRLAPCRGPRIGEHLEQLRPGPGARGARVGAEGRPARRSGDGWSCRRGSRRPSTRHAGIPADAVGRRPRLREPVSPGPRTATARTSDGDERDDDRRRQPSTADPRTAHARPARVAGRPCRRLRA